MTDENSNTDREEAAYRKGYRAGFAIGAATNPLKDAIIETAVAWRRNGHANNLDFAVGIDSLLDAIDRYDVGTPRPTTEWQGEDD